jgi:hypothetical protein
MSSIRTATTSHAGTGSDSLSVKNGVMLVAAVLAIVCTLAFVPTGSLFSRGVAVMAILIGLAQIPIALGWRCAGHWKVREARKTLIATIAIRVLATSLTAAVAFLVRSTEWVVLVATPALSVVAVSLCRAPGNIDRRRKQHDSRKPAEPITGRKPGEPKQPTVVKAPSAELHAAGTTDPAQVPRRPVTFDSGARTLTIKVPDGMTYAAEDLVRVGRYARAVPIATLLATVVMLILCGGTLAIGLVSGIWIGERPSTEVTEGGQQAPPPHELASPPVLPATTPAPTTTPTPVEPGSGGAATPVPTCTTVQQHSGATWKALMAIEALYELELDTETIDKGCFGQIVRYEFRRAHQAKREAFFTTIATAPGSAEKTSLGIDSEHFGTVLLPWAVGPEIQALMQKIGPVGGVGHYPYYAVNGGGGYILIRSWIGTIVFVRRLESGPFQELKPTQARAWIASMKAHHHKWLWPSPPEPGPKGETLIQLHSSESDRIKATVTYHSGSGTAEQDGVEYPSSPVVELNLVELTELSETA